ncbi:hypothetical protein SGFS_015760 [Streptomyces graminofaciens]|uniref:Tat pathway signal sequence domain protein n=1 Tax=Streptomyces graminofaciens TaxID=68212 RepID=A0ABM7F3A0_9ACTN|nr:sortase-dependent protein [Streptomyces graminofaciens]BBC30282.1 hypothetical protein SGFS_015760 [Streptomyces graminofaciens]
MRRTVLSAAALACTAVLAGAVPAFADDASPAPTSRAASQAPTAVPSPAEATKTPDSADATAVPSAEPPREATPGQVSAVPSGAPDTGVAPEESGGGVVAGSAVAVLAVGGAGVLLVRRRRANGA